MTAVAAEPLPCDQANPGHLAAWYGPYGFFEPYRRTTLAHCREACRGEYAAKGERITESRLDDLAHLHPGYLRFLAFHLTGRMAYETMARESLGLR